MLSSQDLDEASAGMLCSRLHPAMHPVGASALGGRTIEAEPTFHCLPILLDD
jgi:hypothetical protein